ncbi:class I SAM-dependent methyltransferase [uncultured Ruegeria sp.]|uniref:class I SAM-dependent methyltransferase n=1 Tax=uncultured Ruegeria sp. TaxID=259304 RepID=UPI0026063066|nr:class I SAM-dependent methyltransferase [uncultured Ruegeria sp.]
MEYDGTTLTDLNAFYSKNDISLWKQVIGDDLHYHFGDFSNTEDPAEALRQTVRNFYSVIPFGSNVLDAGCGWGAPASLLAREHGCNVTGITISPTQAEYCRNLGLNAHLMNLEEFEPEATFDTVLFLESFEHIVEKARLLKRLKSKSRQIIISSNAWGDGNAIYRPTFGLSSAVSTPLELCALLRHCGYEVQSIRDRRPQSLLTLHYWKDNFDRLGEKAQIDSQLRVLKDYTNWITASPARLQEFAQNAPLVDIIARSMAANGGSST